MTANSVDVPDEVGERDIRAWIRERIADHIDLEDPTSQDNPWLSKYHGAQTSLVQPDGGCQEGSQ